MWINWFLELIETFVPLCPPTLEHLKFFLFSSENTFRIEFGKSWFSLRLSVFHLLRNCENIVKILIKYFFKFHFFTFGWTLKNEILNDLKRVRKKSRKKRQTAAEKRKISKRKTKNNSRRMWEIFLCVIEASWSARFFLLFVCFRRLHLRKKVREKKWFFRQHFERFMSQRLKSERNFS